ncbi:MAG: hypothetical protein QOD72_3998 [Acidimicrobiaceae bacterium]|nr:hypothetical protein [Acidimicrobiaceae bacterium]
MACMSDRSSAPILSAVALTNAALIAAPRMFTLRTMKSTPIGIRHVAGGKRRTALASKGRANGLVKGAGASEDRPGDSFSVYGWNALVVRGRARWWPTGHP